MTRKQIEKRCMEEMQQNIPDSEALWQRISANLPEQQTAEEPVQKPIRMTGARRMLTLAASFLIVLSGAYLFTQPGRMDNKSEQMQNDAPAHEDAYQPEDEAPAMNEGLSGSADGILRYENLSLPASTLSLDFVPTGTQGEYFSESAVLADTDCFVKVRVDSMTPDGEALCYTMHVEETFGETVPETETLTIRSETAYVMQQNHLYLLPLCETANGWALAYACAPQMELTLDGDLVFHNGWQTLMQNAPEPLIYTAYGEDDYFYDRMYLTTDTVLQKFLDEWRKLL